jgi:hypothetical protein
VVGTTPAAQKAEHGLNNAADASSRHDDAGDDL